MIKLVCYGSKVLHLKEAYHSYVGEKSFTTIKVITANKIDGHNLSDLQVDLHIIRGIYDDPVALSLNPNKEISEAEVILEDKYTAYEGNIGFYLQFNKTTQDSGKKVIGKTNAVFIDVLDNAKVEKKEEPNNTNNSLTGFPSQGSHGKDGRDGKNGVTYTPSISEDGILSWINDGGLPNPAPINVVGKDGTDGINGADGKDGVNGISATHKWEGTTLIITSASGTSSVDLKGQQGEKGKDGQDYMLTDLDKQNIASIVVDEFDSELLAILGGDSDVTE